MTITCSTVKAQCLITPLKHFTQVLSLAGLYEVQSKKNLLLTKIQEEDSKAAAWSDATLKKLNTIKLHITRLHQQIKEAVLC